jgi:hypothetical protein
MRAPTLLRRAAPLALGLAALAATCDQYPVTPRYPLAVEPETLAFTARQGGLPPIARYLTVSSSGLVEWTAEADVPWLALSPAGGGVPQGVVVAPDNQGLLFGTYRGVVSFAAPSASNSPVRAVVRLDIVAQAPLAGRWLAAWNAAVLSLDLRDSAGAVAGSGLLTVSGTAFTVIGVRTGDNVALTLQPPGGAPLALNAFFFTDHVMRGSLTGPGFPGDSVLVFRQ